MPGELQSLANHLWQSTLFAAAAALLTLALRKNRAQTRYWLWLAASVKFLIPFSVLVEAGSYFGPRTQAALPQPAFTYVIEQVSQPFAAPAPPKTVPAAQFSIPAILWTVWTIGFVVLVSTRLRQWRAIRAALRTASPLDLPIGIRVMTSPEFPEPAVFGILRPVLLMPEGIVSQLTPPQLRAILTHELCHVRRRDNLATAIHMAVETVFWFHPLVWWLGARLMEERERACDEEVLRMGSEPQAYAEGILKICELYLESPLQCVAGVSGGNLKRRIEAIMKNPMVLRLNFAKKAGLAVAGIAAVAAPIVVGVMNAPMRAQSQPRMTFEEISIRAHATGGGGKGGVFANGFSPACYGNPQIDPAKFTIRSTTVFQLVALANGRNCPQWEQLEESEALAGPRWIREDQFDIQAVIPKDTPVYTSAQLDRGAAPQIQMMIQAMLEDRFSLRLRRDMKELPVFVLTVARGGPKLSPPKGETSRGRVSLQRADENGQPKPAGGYGGPGSMPALVSTLGNHLRRQVVDRTGITSEFDFDLSYARADEDCSSCQTAAAALQDKLGLKLDSARAHVEVFVIDHVERPSEN